MRRLPSLLTAVIAIPVVMALPVVSRPAPATRPVAPWVETVGLAATAHLTGVVAAAAPRTTRRFDLVGAAWTGRLDPASTVQVRLHDADGWSGWEALPLPDGGPDGGSADATAAQGRGRQATDGVWVGGADGVEARVVTGDGRLALAPPGLHVVLVNGGSSPADADPAGRGPVLGGSVAEAAAGQPTIYTRAQWGADESLRKNACPSGPDYSPTIKMGFVHHTDTANGYSSSQVPSIIRSIYAYHVESNGWCDIGYNFLVDRFGRVWEGRYGGITRPVIGAHTGGFNYDSFGVSLIGSYGSTAPSSAMLSGLEKLFAWKLAPYYLNPSAKATLTAASFSGSRYAAGTTVTFNLVSGHRDADYTTCPGDAAYRDLPGIRSAVKSLMGAGLVAPSISPTTVTMASATPVSVKSAVLESQSWTLTVTNSLGTTVFSRSGDATSSAPVSTSWQLLGTDGLPVPPGSYTVTLSSKDSSGRTAVPYSAKVTVKPPVTVAGPSGSPYDGTVELTGTAIKSSTVTVHLTDASTGAAQPDRTVTTSSSGAWSTSFAADDDYTWSASLAGYTTPAHTTRVVPTVVSPTAAGGNMFVAASQPLALRGTALPGTTVSLVTTPTGSSTPTAGPALPVAADGSWAASLTPATPTVLQVKDSRGVTSVSYTAYPVGAPAASAPTSWYSAHAVTVTGNAGNAPVAITLEGRPSGSTTWTKLSTATAAKTGAFSMRLPLPATSAATSYGWRVSTAYGSVAGSVTVNPAPAPTSTGPTSGGYGATLTLSGSAVPGDRVALYTRPPGGGTWQRWGSVLAASSGKWTVPYRLTHDVEWEVTAPSGVSSVRKVVVVPTIVAPSTATKGATITVHGTAIPGQAVGVYRRQFGHATWYRVALVTAGPTGAWSAKIRVYYSPSIQARSHGQTSRTLVVKTS